jgi:Domain of unknown function (DUF4177)
MYEYEFVRVTMKWKWTRLDTPAYEKVVQERAQQGWRLVQVVIEQPMYIPNEYTLIFERPSP